MNISTSPIVCVDWPPGPVRMHGGVWRDGQFLREDITMRNLMWVLLAARGLLAGGGVSSAGDTVRLGGPSAQLDMQGDTDLVRGGGGHGGGGHGGGGYGRGGYGHGGYGYGRGGYG